MDIYVLNGMQKEDIVEDYESIIWNMQFFGNGDFQMVVHGTARNVNLLTRGKYLVRDFDVVEDGFRNVMKIEGRKIIWDAEKGWMITLTGKGLKHITGQRIVWQQTNLSETVEDGIRQVITENIISPSSPERQIADFILADPVGISETWETQLFGQNIADWLEDVGKTYGIGWDVSIKNGKFSFELIKGTDRSVNQSAVDPVVFSPDYDNLAESSMEENAESYFNAALIGGEGEGIDQRTATVGTASGLDRIERYIDGDSVSSNGEIITEEQYEELLKTYGNEQLAAAASAIKYEGKTIDNKMFVLNRDYFLGDIVTIKNKYGINSTCRITELIFAIDENGQSIVPTFEAVEGAS